MLKLMLAAAPAAQAQGRGGFWDCFRSIYPRGFCFSSSGRNRLIVGI
jgi:hypothetical protein